MRKNRSAPCPDWETRMDERARCRPLWRKGDATELWVIFLDGSVRSSLKAREDVDFVCNVFYCPTKPAIYVIFANEVMHTV